MKFSVIICAHTQERWQDLIEAVTSVAQQTLPPHQIVVVIDHNPDMLAQAQAEFPTPPSPKTAKSGA
jgi:glycosyltransferase involved in cell wall biosynthesis